MSDQQLRLQASMLEISLQADAMKAANKFREMRGKSQAYGEEAFFQLIDNLNHCIQEYNKYC